jgi:hypothetical protein
LFLRADQLLFHGTVYAPIDLKVLFLRAQVKQLESAVPANEDAIQRLSSALLEERQAVCDLRTRIKEYKVKIYRDELESLRQLRVMKRNEYFCAGQSTRHRFHLASPLTSVHTDTGHRAFHLQARLFRESLRDRTPFPEIPRPAPREVLTSTLAFAHPVPAPLPAIGSGFDILFGCPQQALVPVSAPDFETIAIQQTVAPSAV